MNHIFNSNGHAESIDTLLKDDKYYIWQLVLTNKVGQLAQGIINIGDNKYCLNFLSKHRVPSINEVMYANIVCNYRQLKKEEHFNSQRQ